ncbi:unnamed protein product [Brassica oleracea var. botrytis]
MTSHGSSMDWLRLIITVSNRGGFKAVSENAAWDKVGQESGLGLGAKLIYVKYLAALARWLNSDSSPGLPGTSKDLIARLRDFVSQAKSNYELRKVGAEFKWLLEKVDKDHSSPGKMKRECSVETLKWLSEAAKDPCDTSNASLPDRSKWDSYGSEEPWKQLLLFRASRTNTTDSACEKTWQKIQKMHPSLYRDSAGPSYNLRERLSSQFNERKAGKDESCGLLCSEFQAQVPDWSLIASESDSKWFDTLMPPLNKEQNNNNRLTERDPIGNGDSNKMLTMLVSAMGECALSILREPAVPQHFLDGDSLHDFCISALKIISCLVEDVIASPWISPPELIHLCASFPETGDNIKHSKKVSIAFELCIRTVWNCVRLICLKFESNSSEDFVSEKAVTDFVSEACRKSAYYLDVLEQYGELKIEELVFFILETWSLAKKLIASLPDLTPIIQQWVKIQHKRHKSPDLADSCTLFHSLLLSSQKISKIVTGNILEQEILAYEEFVPVCSKLCRANQIKIADILLKDVIITKDLFLERARVLTWKARIARAEQERVEKECVKQEGAKQEPVEQEPVKQARVEKELFEQDCVRHLSEGISNLESISNEGHETCFQLTIIYFLRALYFQETKPESKQIFEDINKSLNLCVWIQSGETMPLENVIPLLFNVIDLVSIKGWIELHQRIYDLMFRIFKGRNVRLKDALAMLWDCRRLSHALCPSPIDDAVITGLSCYFDEISESTDFWKSCLQFSKAKSIGFELSIHESDITIVEIKRTASKLDTTSKPVSSVRNRCIYYFLLNYTVWLKCDDFVSQDPLPCFSSFVAASLYYDLCERELSCGNLYKLGGIWELMGERDRAGNLLSWGKTVSSIQSLQPFVLAFSLALGNLYNKMQCRDLAEKELQNAKKLLTDSQKNFPCRNCKLMLEVTLDKQFGDLSQRQSESLYSAALQKICCPAWKGCINQTAEVEKPRDSKMRRGGGALIVHACEMKEQPIIRLTRSMSRSLEERPQNFPAKKCRFIDESDICDAKGLMRDTKNRICVCINRISQQHLSNEVTRSGLPNNFISLKWQFYQRRLACTVLVSLGKCLAKSGKVHQAHGAILHSIAALYNSTVSILSSPSSRSPLLDFIGKEIKGDVFGLDRARILYNLCKLSLQTYHSRSVLCDLSHIPYQTLVSLLTLAFVLSREDPILCRKISRLLAVLYLVSSIGSEFSLPCDGELSLSHWVTYYHQASLGANSNYHFLSKFMKSGRNSDKEASEEFDFLRLAPKSTDGLVKFAKNFFNGLPETTAICISVLGGTLSKLLQELLKSPQVCGWLLLSRLSSKSQQPLAVLLPIYSSLGEAGGIEKMDKRWDSPWGSTVVDVVAPAFRLILKEYNFAGSQVPMEDEKLRWKEIDELELRLNKLLRNLEDTWLGPWRHLLLGESSNSKSHESTQKKLVEELRAKCNMEVNETLLKVFLGNDTAKDGDSWISQLCSKNGCCIGGHPSDHIDEENGSSISDDLRSRYRLALQLIRDSGIKLEDYNEKREPIILVLDHEIQMLPWENIPTLRRQEVYRMPSVGSISAVLKKSCYREDPSPFLVIDPRDSCYLLDPKYNCKTLQTVLEGLSEIKEIKVEAGLEPPAPSAQELNDALGNRDLFLYHGHGSGDQYIPMRKVENMNKCSAAFLMGCCSGLPYRGGRYVPKSVPISFLLAGSPVIVATLWDVPQDISQFVKAMLESFWRERSDDVKPERIGSLMADARYACAQQFLTGAAIVCYGVPTAITTKRKKKNT